MRRACLALACALAMLAFGGQLIMSAPAASANPALNPALNNEGISPVDGAATTANFDGAGSSYSNHALAAVGFASGANVHTQGLTFQWPTVANGTSDNWEASGQVITVAPSVASSGLIALLGASSNGPSTGTATLTFTDATTQTFTLGFSDWTLNAGRSTVMSGDTIVATTTYRDQTNGGHQSVKTYVFYTAVTFPVGKTVASVTLPSTTSKGQIHVFAVSGRATSSATNNEGVSPRDGARTAANYDGGGYNYSNTALAAAGVVSGGSVTTNGVTFNWPTIAEGAHDNWIPAGQIIPVTATGGGALAFLGSATNGPSSGTAAITYTDNTVQTFTLSFSDWTLGAGRQPLADGNTVVATTSYRDKNDGSRQTVTTYLYYTSVATLAGKTVASVQLPTSDGPGSLHIFAVGGVGPTVLPPSPTDWSTYLGSIDHTGYNSAETILTSSTISSLHEKWEAHGGLAISAQPIQSNGVLYWGSWDGNMHATNLAGASIWTHNLGQNTDANCTPQTAGIASTPTIGAIGATTVVFVGGGNANFYALDAATGAVLWKTSLGATPAHFLWGSPTVYNGSVYIGIASFGDCPLVQGGLYQLDATTGAVQHFFATVPNGCVGNGVWGTPTVDSATNTVYFATGNGGSCSANESMRDSLIAVNATNLSLISSWAVPASQETSDGDFGNTPTLFTAGSRKMIGLANKNGIYYAFDRANISAGPVWQERVAFDSGDCPQCGDGSISPSAWDGTTLYVAGGNTTISGSSCRGSVRALNPANGAVLWAHCLTAGTVMAAVDAIPGVVIVTEGAWVNALSTATGATLFSFEEPNHSTVFMSAASVVNGRLYAASGSGNLFAFGL
ncbi:MAG TPA: PQQ-binding-like beta-propeller repeat protein [Ktedonobacterales bacterium]|nr:PQQ-binding-like beta-propeller repeat protein [Ktedonobacterales bacterium]